MNYQKVRVLYDWITSNISYDYQKMESLSSSILSPDSLLSIKKGVCGDFAALTASMMESVGITCDIVSGIGKYDPNDLLTLDTLLNRHAWNVVSVDNRWRFIDCTWGAILKKVDSSDNRFFLVDPGQFSYTHFPDDAKQAFISKPITFEEFRNVPIVKDYFKYSEKLPPANGIYLTKQEDFVIENIELLNISDSLLFALENTDREADIGHVENPVKVVQRKPNSISLNIYIPQKGSYFLSVKKEEKSEYGFNELKTLLVFLIIRN